MPEKEENLQKIDLTSKNNHATTTTMPVTDEMSENKPKRNIGRPGKCVKEDSNIISKINSYNVVTPVETTKRKNNDINKTKPKRRLRPTARK